MLRLPPFRLVEARTVEEAVAARAAASGAAAYVAGGTDLYPHMKRGQDAPETVVALGAIEELRTVEPLEDGGLRLGAGTTLERLAADPRILEGWPALAEAAGRAATPTIRAMGTLGGNLCLDTRCNYYDQSEAWRRAIGFCLKKDGERCGVAPSSSRCWAVQSSDTAPAAVALGAAMELAGPGGRRTVAARDFYRDDGMAWLAKTAEELLVAVRLPAPKGTSSRYTKVSRRGSFDFPVLGVAAWIRHEGPGAPVEAARLVLGAVTSAPVTVEAAAGLLLGSPLGAADLDAVAEAAWKKARPLDNTDHEPGWRKQVVRTTVRRTLAVLGENEGRG